MTGLASLKIVRMVHRAAISLMVGSKDDLRPPQFGVVSLGEASWLGGLAAIGDHSIAE